MAPERFERPVEGREVLVAMHKKRPARVVHIVPRADVHVLECLDDVEHASRVHVEATATQQAAEGEEVLDERGCQTLPSARRRAREHARQPLAAEGFDILAGLERDAQRFFEHLEIQRVRRLATERHERGHPVERLRHAGRFVQLRRPQLLDDGGDLARETGGGLRRPLRDDCDLLVEARIVD